MSSEKIAAIVESIETLNVLELVELKKTMEEKWGVTA
ncbi:MAG: 50S ribosomal protein L7/L12, partial [Chloroflexia bacterium]|nr:50S ribosomal protein L7/L12 [Chloroflexia bacterium]